MDTLTRSTADTVAKADAKKWAMDNVAGTEQAPPSPSIPVCSLSAPPAEKAETLYVYFSLRTWSRETCFFDT